MEIGTGNFEDAVVKYFRETVSDDAIKELIHALWDRDEGTSGRILSDLLWDTISYNDYHEDYYHAFLAGIFEIRKWQFDGKLIFYLSG